MHLHRIINVQKFFDRQFEANKVDSDLDAPYCLHFLLLGVQRFLRRLNLYAVILVAQNTDCRLLFESKLGSYEYPHSV